MNERIKELLAQAYKEAPGCIEDKVTSQEKFADLIVEECNKKINDNALDIWLKIFRS